MIDFDLVEKFGLDKLVEIGCRCGKQIAHEKMNKKKRNIVKLNYGDTLEYLLVSERYELTKELIHLLSIAFDSTFTDQGSARNIQWILTKKKYKRLSNLVSSLVLNEDTIALLHALSDDCKDVDPTIEQHIRETVHNVLKDAEVTYTPGETKDNDTGFFVQEG